MSPHQLIQSNIEDYRSGKQTHEAFLDSVTQIEKFVQGFSGQLKAMEPPLADAQSESVRKLVEACVSRFQSAVAEMRRAVEMRDVTILDKALDLATQGESLVNEVLIRYA